jgi:ribonuclease P protein component
LPKRYRLLRPANFSAVLDHRCRTRDAIFTVYGKPNSLAHVRLGVVVSRKVSLKAVVRNRVKRLVRESARHHQQQLTGMDLVVIAQRDAAVALAPGISTSLERHWTSIIGRCREP